MNKTINEIINNYTSGKTPVGGTNKALRPVLDFPFSLERMP